MDKVELTRAAQQQLPSHDRQGVDYANFRKLVLEQLGGSASRQVRCAVEELDWVRRTLRQI
jgi:hypothetical protein